MSEKIHHPNQCLQLATLDKRTIASISVPTLLRKESGVKRALHSISTGIIRLPASFFNREKGCPQKTSPRVEYSSEISDDEYPFSDRDEIPFMSAPSWALLALSRTIHSDGTVTCHVFDNGGAMQRVVRITATERNNRIVKMREDFVKNIALRRRLRVGYRGWK